jgi:hypothetical protein
MNNDWRERVDAVWASANDENEAETFSAITALAAERPDAASAFMALTLSSMGRDRAALATALDALAGQLPEYGRAVRNYAMELTT